jgi:hypothetical protein
MAGNTLERDSSLTSHDASATATNFFTGSVSTGSGSFDPYVSGYAFIAWIKVPTWLDNAEEFKQLSQKNFKQFQGLNNLDLDTGGVHAGFTNNEVHYATAMAAKPTEFTLQYQEHSGSPLGKMYDQWVSGIRDPKTGIATYPAQYGLEYHSSNHTGVLLYVVTRPDADNFSGKNIERAFLWTNVMPKRINLEHYSFTSGDHNLSELDQPFAAVLNFGQQVDAFASSYISSRVYPFYTENSFNDISAYTGS